MKTTGAKLGGILGRGMKAGAIGVLGGLALGGVFLKGAIADASDLSEATSKVGVVFGKQAGQILKASKTSARAMGLSKTAYLDATGTLGNLLVSLDIAPKKSAALSKQMVKLAGDLASFNNASPDEALLALKSGLTGETEPLKRFGVNMNDATLHAEALKLGLIKNIKDALNPQAKALAAQSLIMSQTKTAQGDFARTSGGLANQQRILSAQFADVKTSLGRIFLPVATRVFRFLNDTGIPALSGLGDWFKRLKKPIGEVVGKIGNAAGDVKDFFTTGAGATALQGALDTVKTTADKIKDGFTKAADALGTMKDKASGFSFGDVDTKALGKTLGTALTDAIGHVLDGLGSLTDKIGAALGNIDWVGLGITLGTKAPALLIGLATGLINGLTDPALFKGIWEHLPEIIFAALAIAFAPSKFIGPLERILTRIPFVGRFLAAAVHWLSELGTKITKFGGDLFRQFAKGFGSIRFPGAGIISKVLGALKGLPGRVREFVSLLGTRIGVWALDAFEALGRGARTAIGRLTKVVSGIAGKVTGALKGAGSWLLDTGKDIVRGLISGIGAIKDDVVKALLDLIPGPLKKFAGKLGIKSPSRVFHGYGENIGQGLTNGIDSQRQAVTNSVDRLAESLRKAGKKKLKAALASLNEQLDTLKSKAADLSSSVRDAFRPDLFGGTLGDLVGGLTSGLANVRAALAAFPKLVAAGVGGDFLQRLMASGNTQLIAALGANPTQAKNLQGQFNQLQSLSGQLGTKVANNATSADIASVTHELVQIKKLLAKAPKEHGRETSRALNHGTAAPAGRRKSRRH
jgi:hypothetical protein